MIPRLYITAPLSDGAAAPLDEAQAHYLRAVLRREAGDDILLFNGRDGEFAAEIAALKKRSGLAAVKYKTREQVTPPGLGLYCAPVKRGALEAIVQKATEIGVAYVQPVITERTVAPRINPERLQAIATEAAEQCGRLSVPTISSPVKLAKALDAWPGDRHLVFCDEAGDDQTQAWGGRGGRAAPMLAALNGAAGKANNNANNNADDWALLTGPEGGFSPEERALLRSKDFVTPATLGPRILRADTAAIAALVLWQAALGDWRER